MSHFAPENDEHSNPARILAASSLRLSDPSATWLRAALAPLDRMRQRLACAVFAIGLGATAAVASETITIRSGQVSGTPGAPGQHDDCLTYVAAASCCTALSALPFDQTTLFQDACSGPPAELVEPNTAWLSSLPCDPEARWINWRHTPGGNGTGRPPASVLYACEFEVTTPGASTGTIEFCWAVDDRLGDPAGGPNQIGVYINGVPLGLAFSGGSFSVETTTVESFVPLHTGTNKLHVYQRDVAAVVSGIIFSAEITVGSSRITRICFGDGSGTPCPCGNDDGPGAGCANSTGLGASLDWTGSNSISACDLVLIVTNAIPGQPGLFFQGDGRTAGGNGVPFGDGLRCCSSNVIRLQVVVPNGAGTAPSTVCIGMAGGASPGDTRCYQYWYRDPHGSPCSSGFNLTNAIKVTWKP